MPVQQRPHRPLRGIAFTCAAALVLTVQDGFIKWLVEDLSVLQLLFVRSIVVVLVIFTVTKARTGHVKLSTTRPLEHGIRIVATILAFGMFFTAIRIAPLADLVALMMTAPLLVAVLSGPLLGERTGVGEWVGILIGFAGVLIMTLSGGSSLSPLAVGLSLGASLSYSLFVIVTRRLSDTEKTETLLIYSAGGTSLFCLPVMFVLWVTPEPLFLAGMLVLGLISTLGHWLLVTGYSSAPAYVVAPFDYTALVWAVLLGLIFWSEFPAPNVIVGALVIVTAGLIIIYTNYARRRVNRDRLS